MSSLYSGNSGNVSIASTIQVTLPSDGDARNVASVNVCDQKQSDYLEAFRQMFAGSGLPISEGFETSVPPASPLNAWAVPSKNFGSDSVWARSTTNPIAGTASASAPVPQTASTNSSLGLTVAFVSPARISFLFALNCNNNNGDHLDFYVDGVLTAQLSTVTSNTLVGGRFVSDLLREGLHTFDWRFVRGGSASVGSEECKIDTVEIISDLVWQNDATRVYFMDEGFPPPQQNLSAGADLIIPPWFYTTGANAGSIIRSGGGLPGLGVVTLRVPPTAAGDFSIGTFSFPSGAAPNGGLTAAKLPFVEGRLGTSTALNVNLVFGVGLGDSNGPATENFIGWAWDGSNGAGSNFRWRASNAGAQVNADSGVAGVFNTLFRLGVTVATVRGVTGAVFTKDGKALPGAGSVPPLIATGLPANFSPTYRVRSITAAAAGNVDLDWLRVMMLR